MHPRSSAVRDTPARWRRNAAWAMFVLAGLVLASCGSTAGVEAADVGSTVGPTAVPATSAPAATVPAATVPPATVATPIALEPRGVAVTNIDVDRFPVVLAVEAIDRGDGSWRFAVTLSSPYDTPQRYADAWRVLDGDDTELGIRVLAHDHANEQPFTRSHTVVVPPGMGEVYVEGRDQVNGWSGQRYAVELSTT